MKANLDITLDCGDPEKLSEFWRRALGYRVLGSDGSYVVLVPVEAVAPPLVLQRVAEPKAGRNRMHIDLVTDQVEAEVARLEGLGALRLHDEAQRAGDARWLTMANPEGNEFCACTGVSWRADRSEEG